MGQIDHAIYQNYQKALKKGDVNQARKSVELARYFKRLTEQAGFVDYKIKTKPNSNHSFQNPITYKYYPNVGYVYLDQIQIKLTKRESQLFELLIKNQSTLENIKLITDQMIKNHLWPNKQITSQAIRVTIKRLRNKLENNKEIIQNIYSKGYLFWAQRTY